MNISEQALREVAEDIRPHLTPDLQKKSHVDDDDIRRLTKLHAKHAVVSERSCSIVQEYLCES